MNWTLTSPLASVLLVGAPFAMHAKDGLRWTEQEEHRALALIERFDRNDAPGCAIGVVRYGELVFAAGAGVANLDYGILISPRTAFDLASVSKQFTAAAILLLCERGELSLDDEVRRYIPELPDYGTPITLRHLIHHTSGIRDYIQLLWLAGLSERHPWTRENLIELIAQQRHLTFPPGEEHYYSNSGYLLLAAVVERVSEGSFGAFLESEFFLPLGMEHTVVYDDPGLVIRNRAIGYELRGWGFAVDQYPEFIVPGDGGIFTTVEDLARWEAALAFGGIPAFDSEDFTRKLHESGRLNDGTSTDYAFGLELCTSRGLRVIGHDGGWGGFRAQVLRFPDDGVSVIVLANRGDIAVKKLAYDIAEIYLGDRMTTSPDGNDEAASSPPSVATISLPDLRLTQLQGTYRCPASGSVWEFDVRDGKLGFRSILGEVRYVLEPTTPEVFRVVSPPRSYLLRFDASGSEFRQSAGQEEDVFHRIERHRPTEQDLNSCSGRYLSEELGGVVFDVTSESGRAFLERPNRTREELIPVFEDLFLTRDLDVRFGRGADGKVDSFFLTKWRLEDIAFHRLPAVSESR